MIISVEFINVLSDPRTKLPEDLGKHIFKDNFTRTLTTNKLFECFSKFVLVRFVVGEARLVLPIYEGEFPGDSRPRDAVLAAEAWLENRSPASRADAVDAADAASVAADAAYAVASAASVAASAVYAVASAASADAAAYAAAAAAAASADPADAAARAAYAAARAAYAASVAVADPSISLEDQLKRLFKLAHENQNAIQEK